MLCKGMTTISLRHSGAVLPKSNLAPIEADCAALADWELDLRLWKGCLAVKNQQHVFSGGAMERKAGGAVRRNPGWRFGINVEKLNVLQMEKNWSKIKIACGFGVFCVIIKLST